MDVIDILGSMLGHKSSEPGKGTDVLTDILRRGSQSKGPRRQSASFIECFRTNRYRARCQAT